jgi:hypothetical protein
MPKFDQRGKRRLVTKDEGREITLLRDYRPIQVSEHPEKEALERLA